jgi:hypothetical protein
MVEGHTRTKRGKRVACWSSFPLEGVHRFESPWVQTCEPNGSVLLSFSCSSFTCGLKLCVEMPEYCGYGGKFVSPNGEPED